MIGPPFLPFGAYRTPDHWAQRTTVRQQTFDWYPDVGSPGVHSMCGALASRERMGRGARLSACADSGVASVKQEPFRESAGYLDKVIEVHQSRFFEEFDEIGDIVGAGERPDGDEGAFDAEFIVGEVEDAIDVFSRESGRFEGGASDGEGGAGGGEWERHDRQVAGEGASWGSTRGSEVVVRAALRLRRGGWVVRAGIVGANHRRRKREARHGRSRRWPSVWGSGGVGRLYS